MGLLETHTGPKSPVGLDLLRQRRRAEQMANLMGTQADVLKKNKNQLLPLNVWTLIEHDSVYTVSKGPFQQGLLLC